MKPTVMIIESLQSETSSLSNTTMKLIKQDIEITMDQLKELFQYHPADLKCLLESAK